MICSPAPKPCNPCDMSPACRFIPLGELLVFQWYSNHTTKRDIPSRVTCLNNYTFLKLHAANHR
jgi:hypothetical protein